MKKTKRRLLTGLLCVMLFMAYVMSSVVPASAANLPVEQGSGKGENNEDDDGEKNSSGEDVELGTEDDDVTDANREVGDDLADSSDTGLEDAKDDEDGKETSQGEGFGEENENRDDAAGGSGKDGSFDADEELIDNAEERLALMVSIDDIASGTYRDLVWVIDANGKLTVEGAYDLDFGPNQYYLPWRSYKTSIISVEFNVTGFTDVNYLFGGYSNLKSLDLSGFDTSKVTNMSEMFYECINLTNLNLSGFDTSKVTDMSHMFYRCESLASLDVSNFDTSKVTNMESMFYKCYNLISLNLSNFSTSNVTNMRSMFYKCESLASLDVGNFDTDEVTDMSYMFDYCESLSDLDVSNFDTSNVKSMKSIFSGCESLTSLNLSNFNTSNVTDMGDMFSGCESLISLDVEKFDTNKVMDISYMFDHCESLTDLDVSNFDTSNVKSMRNIFYGCSNLASLDVSNFDTSNITDMSGMFSGCYNLTSLNVSNFDTSNVTDMGGMFSGCNSLTSLGISGFHTANVTNMSGMFSDCRNLTSLDVSNFNTSKVTDMSRMFSSCNNLTSLDVSNFNTSNVVDMSYMFQSCKNLTNLNLSNFVTNNVENIDGIVSENKLTELDLSGFNLSKAVCETLDGWWTIGGHDLSTVYAPCNLQYSILLPTSYRDGILDVWYRSDGTTVTELPQNLNYSVMLMKNKIPTQDSSEEDTADDKLKYVQNLTQVSLKDADIESKKFIQNAIYNLLFKAEYRPMKSEIPDDTMIFTGTKEIIAKWPIQNKDYNTQAYWKRTVKDAQLGSIKFNNAGAGCMAYAYFATTYTYGTNGSAKKCYNTSADGIRQFIHQYADPGEHLRYNKPHSLVFLGESLDGKGFYCISYEGGVSKRGTYHLLRLMYKSYASFESEIAGSLSIFDTNNGSYYNGTAKTITDVRDGNGADRIITRIACPVEAIIEHNGEIIDSRSPSTVSYGTVERDGDEIVFILDYYPDYNLSIVGTGEGVMTLTLEYYDSNDVLIDQRQFVRFPIKDSTEIRSSGFDFQSTFILYGSDNINEVETWGANIGETVYAPDNIYRGDNESAAEFDDDSDTVFPDDIPADGIPDTFWIAGIDSTGYQYTGKPIKPTVRVYDGNKILKAGQDYTLSYKNNIAANDASNTAKSPTIIVKGKGNYGGKETATFKILPIDLNDTSVITEDIVVANDGKLQKKVPTLTYNGKKLSSKKDFIISYPALDEGIEDAYKAVGTYDILLTAKDGGNFIGTRTVELIVTDSILISKATVSKIPAQYYLGTAMEPYFTVTYNDATLVENKDYTFKYENNIAPGKAAIILTGIGDYAGTKKVYFTIKGPAFKNVTVEGIENKVYNGSKQEQQIYVRLDNIRLTEGVDYKVEYSNNQNAGKATITIKGINAYSGTAKKTFKITAYDIKTNELSELSGFENEITAKYTKGGAKPKPTPTLTFAGKQLVEGKDYTITYKNNKAVTTEETQKLPTITIKGKGNFKGTLSKTFTITSKALYDEEAPVILAVADKGFVNKAGNYISNPTLTDIDGKKLIAGTDYEKEIIYSLEDGTPLTNESIVETGTNIKVKVIGKGAYYGELEKIYRITENDFSKAKVKITPKVYTGSPITLNKDDIDVRIGEDTLIYGIDYEVIEDSYANNKNKGSASVTIIGKESYGGMKISKFKITTKGFIWFWRML